MNKSKQIKYGAIISYVAIFINILAMLIYTPWMKNQIGISHYGLYTLANSFITMFLMDFGIAASVARFLSKYRAENNHEAINNFLGIVYKLFIAIDFVIFSVLIVLYFFVDRIYVGLTANELEHFKVIYLILAGFSVISFPFTTLSGIFNAYEKFIALKICDLVQKFLNILLVVIALLLNCGLITVVLLNAISGLCGIIVKLILLRGIHIKPNFKIKDRCLTKELFGFSIWTTIIGLASRLTYNIAPSILGVFSNSIQIALYSPASAIAGYFYTFAAAINGLFLPTISRKIAQNKEDDILDLMVLVGRFQVFILGILWVGVICIGKEFMVMWMGEEFKMSYYCTIVLALPTIIEYSQQIANTTMIAKNMIKYQAFGLMAISIINLVISSTLSKLYGAVGVSIGICITSFLNLIYINIIYYKKLKINVFEFYKKCYISIFLVIIASLAVLSVILRLINNTGWTWLVIKGIIVVVVFSFFSFIFHLKKDERRKVYLKVRNFISKSGGEKDV